MGDSDDGSVSGGRQKKAKEAKWRWLSNLLDDLKVASGMGLVLGGGITVVMFVVSLVADKVFDYGVENPEQDPLFFLFVFAVAFGAFATLYMFFFTLFRLEQKKKE